MNRLRFHFAGLAALTMSVLVPCQASAEEKLVWSITPYAWATETSYDLKADGNPVDDGTVSFSDLMSTTDATFQIAVEVGRELGHWSFMTDITYIETSDDTTVVLPNVGTLRVDSEAEQIHADFAVAYWPWSEAGGLSLMAGIRYTDLDDNSEFRLIDPDVGFLGNVRNQRDFTDALFGVRYQFDLAERWRLNTRADYGFGDSEGIFQMHALIRYAVGRNQQNGILFGYRYKDSGFDKGGIEEDYNFKGPVVGFNFRF